MEAMMIMKERIINDLVFCWFLDKTIHLGINPINGGIPAKESNKIDI